MAVDHNNPQSRDEEILIATIDGKEYDKAPQSRMEELLLELKETIEEGGGGGGTTNYENLSNKPQVNGHTLSGNTTGADLDLVDAEDGKGLSTNDYDDNEKAAVAAATSAISAMKDGTDLDSFGDVEVALLNKADTADLGTAAAKDSTNAVTSGSTDLVESGAVKTAIDAAVAGAYHHAGTKTCAELVAGLLVKANEGNVYNMTDSGTTTSDFMEGIGYPIKAGDNVGVAKVSDGVYKFDLLSGFVDTTNFVQKSQTSGLLKNDGTVNDEIEDDVDQLKSGLTNLDNEVNGDATLYTYADVITINDAVPSNLADCSVKIEPIQDLHGYDKPWVGGAGKNQAYDVEYNDVTAQYGLVMAASYKLKQGKKYVISFDTPNSGVTVYRAEPSQLGFNSLSLYSFYCNGTRKSMYGVATADADFTGKHILLRFDETSATGTGELSNLQIEEVADDVTTPTDYAPYENICPITGHTEASVEVTDGDETTKTYTLALGDTIYGGTVDFETGVMTVTHAYAHAKDFTWGFNGTSATSLFEKTTGIPKAYGKFNIISDKLASDGDYALVGRVDSSTVDIKVPVSVAANDTEFAAWLNTENPEVCYELATPTTIQLTPQQIQLLQGTNTLTASTGQISVTVNGVSGAIGSLQEQVNDHEERIETVESGKQNKTDNSLQTTDKTIVGGINELKSGLIKVVSGTETFTDVSPGAAENLTVYPQGIVVAHAVTCLDADGAMTNTACGVRNITNHSINIYARNNGSTAVTIKVMWVAFGS